MNVPVLARWIEEAGVPTVVVTNMPDVADRLGCPRVVGVEFPYGHPFGWVGAQDVQEHVLLTALTLLSGAARPGVRVDVDIVWPVERAQAYRDWQPAVPSPIVQTMLDRREGSAG